MICEADDKPWLLDASNRLDVERYLISRGAITENALPIAIARAGAGNMNLALRVTTADRRSFILKQGRPWVEKYAHIPAPFERTLVEAAFYSVVQSSPDVAGGMPAILDVDARNHVLFLEDIGGDGDFTSLYADPSLPPSTLAALLDWLDRLARVAVPLDARGMLVNHAMRTLNHEHMFRFPLASDNGLDLNGITAGLAAAARELIDDRAYCQAVETLGQRYLADGATLVHGDYFPGSWLRTARGVRVIDPEFCFLGDAEFDCGVVLAHLAIAGCGGDAVEMIAAAVEARRLDHAFVAGYAGVEIMRRLIGVAQLPLTFGIDRKRMLLRLSRRLVLEPSRGLM